MQGTTFSDRPTFLWAKGEGAGEITPFSQQQLLSSVSQRSPIGVFRGAVPRVGWAGLRRWFRESESELRSKIAATSYTQCLLIPKPERERERES